MSAFMKASVPRTRRVRQGPPNVDRDLRSWLAGSGAEVSPLSIDLAVGAGRGVRTRAPVASDTTVLAIPLRCLVTSDVVRGSAVGRAVAASGVALRSPHSIFAAFLLHEQRDPRSRWRPYTDSLPRSFSTHPLFFGADDLALLQGSMTLAQIEARRAAIRDDHQALSAGVPDLCRFSYTTFQHARIAVTSRIFGLTIDGRRTEALVPLADMLNHRHPPETRWTYDEGQARS